MNTFKRKALSWAKFCQEQTLHFPYYTFVG